MHTTGPSMSRSRIEAAIEALLALLDATEPDPDLEDGGDFEPNGDEHDCSGHEEEVTTVSLGDGTGYAIALGMVQMARRMRGAAA